MDVRIGISGWRYEPWRGVFYPEGLPRKKELYYASRRMNSIEINGSFYNLQRPESYLRWHGETPRDFLFSVKGPRYITHVRRLREAATPTANFFASGVLHLKEKLGPVLWQLPPSFLFREDRIEEFFRILPRTFGAAAELALKADRGNAAYPGAVRSSKRKIRHALEVRHHSFENPDFIALLRAYDVALVFADTAGKWPYMEDFTSDFLYLRLHGEIEIYKSGYDENSLRFWARRIRLWRQGKNPKNALTISDTAVPPEPKDIHVYFDNDVKVRAPFDAIRLAEILNAAGRPARAAA